MLGRIVPLLPDETLISGVPASVRGHSQQDIQDMLDKVGRGWGVLGVGIRVRNLGGH